MLIDPKLTVGKRKTPGCICGNSPEYLQARHGFPREFIANIAIMEVPAAGAAE